MWYICHYGVGAKDNPPGRGSGRYPLGSGKRPYQNGNKKWEDIVAKRYDNQFKYEDLKTEEEWKSTKISRFLDKNEDKMIDLYKKYLPFSKKRISELDKYKQTVKHLENRWKREKVDEESGFHIKNRKFSPEEDMIYVNPGVVNFSESTKNNCVLCSVTYELRRRGYDVTANRSTAGYNEYYNYPKWFKNPKIKYIPIEKVKGYVPGTKIIDPKEYDHEGVRNKVVKELTSQGVGARGNLFVSWDPMGFSGHAIAYEVTNKGLVIRDCQVNKVFTDTKINELFDNIYDVDYVRLDNLKINKKNIKECSR